MKRVLKVLLVIGVLGIIPASLSGCNTVEGLGQDTRALGDAITGASRDTRGY